MVSVVVVFVAAELFGISAAAVCIAFAAGIRLSALLAIPIRYTVAIGYCYWTIGIALGLGLSLSFNFLTVSFNFNL